jgi:hypothetical protein
VEKWLLNVETNCADPAKEKEFNEWYDKTHLADILETPGAVRASRYENANYSEGQPKFMAVYEMETEDINQTMAAFGERLNKVVEQGRMSELAQVVGVRLYKQITAPIERRKTS